MDIGTRVSKSDKDVVLPRPLLAICEGVIRFGDLGDDLTAAAAAGYAAVQIETQRVEAVGTEKAARMLGDSGMIISSLGGTVADPLGRQDDSMLLRSIDIAAELGIPLVALHPGHLGGLPHQEARARTRSWLEKNGQRAASVGVGLALEPIHPIMRHYSWVHTLRHAADLVAGIEGASVLVDVGHLWWDPDLVNDFRQHVELIRLVQLTNVNSKSLSELRYERCALGTGDVPVVEFVEAFRDAGYRGAYEHEVRLQMPRTDRVAFIRSEREWFAAQFD